MTALVLSFKPQSIKNIYLRVAFPGFLARGDADCQRLGWEFLVMAALGCFGEERRASYASP